MSVPLKLKVSKSIQREIFMKTPTNKIDTISLSELMGIRRRLIANLSPKELAEFVLSLSDNIKGSTEYWYHLYKGSSKILDELE